jgi:hypothetical protein
VDVYPALHRDGLAPDPDDDAFAKSAVRVAALVSEVLPALDLPARIGHVRVLIDPDWPPYPSTIGPAVVDRVIAERSEGMHFAGIRVPWRVAELTPAARGLLVLDVIELVLHRLGDAMGWVPDRFGPVREHVLARGVEFRWAGDWKQSPDRRSQARMAFRIDDDGWGIARVEVESAAGRRADDEFKCRADAKDLRWRDAEKVLRPGWVDGPRTPAEREAELAVVAQHVVPENLGDYDAMLRFLGALATLDERPPVEADINDLGDDPWAPPAAADDSTPRPAVVFRSRPRL